MASKALTNSKFTLCSFGENQPAFSQSFLNSSKYLILICRWLSWPIRARLPGFGHRLVICVQGHMLCFIVNGICSVPPLAVFPAFHIVEGIQEENGRILLLHGPGNLGNQFRLKTTTKKTKISRKPFSYNIKLFELAGWNYLTRVNQGRLISFQFVRS